MGECGGFLEFIVREIFSVGSGTVGGKSEINGVCPALDCGLECLGRACGSEKFGFFNCYSLILCDLCLSLCCFFYAAVL